MPYQRQDSRADWRARRFFVDITGSFHETSLAGSRFAMLCVDDLTRFKMVRFLKCKSDPTAAMRDVIATHVAPFGLELGIVRADGGGEFDGPFHSLLREFEIQHERTPPHSPEYNGVVQRALGLLRDKTVALPRDVTEGKTDQLWAEAMNYACDMSTRCVTTSIDRGISPFQLWYGHASSFDGLLPFRTVGYMKRPTPAHKRVPRGAECILLGTSTSHPRTTFHIRDLTPGSIVLRQSVP